MNLPSIETTSAAVHEAWIESKKKQGVSSRKSEAGEELMIPYEELSEKAKDLDRGTVKAVYAAIKSCATGIELIAAERMEQIEKHGRTIEHDVEQNDNEQLSMGAEMLLAVGHEEGIDPESYPDGWDKDICMKMINKPYKERLIIAGALIAAELDRLKNK